MDFNIWRALINNDCYQKNDWDKLRMSMVQTLVHSVNCRKTDSGCKITVDERIGAPSRVCPVSMQVTWEIDTLGIIRLTADVTLDEKVSYLPRFGIRIGVDKSFSTDDYFGLGPNESYIDKHNSCYMGRLKNNIDDELTPDYLVPQECGNHYDTRWGCFYDKDGTGLMFRTESPDNGFDFSALPYSQEELQSARHGFELPKSTANYICVDFMQSGVGSNACGPALPDKYRLKDKQFTYYLEILPVLPKNKDLNALANSEFTVR